MTAKMIQATLEKLNRAIASVREMNGYCLVDSESESAAHVVTVNPTTRYSTYCTCKAGLANMDCYHRVAVDRYYDGKRQVESETLDYTLYHAQQEQARRREAFVQAFSIYS